MKEPGVTEPKKKLLKAGELARRTGLTRQSLHQYVLLGLLQPVEMTQGGQRLFTAEAEERIALIRNLLASGYTLRDVRDIFFKEKP
jgi:DNA-binding transcriptional MerR regulator